jgi:hypothetical protein
MVGRAPRVARTRLPSIVGGDPKPALVMTFKTRNFRIEYRLRAWGGLGIGKPICAQQLQPKIIVTHVYKRALEQALKFSANPFGFFRGIDLIFITQHISAALLVEGTLVLTFFIARASPGLRAEIAIILRVTILMEIAVLVTDICIAQTPPIQTFSFAESANINFLFFIAEFARQPRELDAVRKLVNASADSFSIYGRRVRRVFFHFRKRAVGRLVWHLLFADLIIDPDLINVAFWLIKTEFIGRVHRDRVLGKIGANEPWAFPENPGKKTYSKYSNEI